MSVHRNRDSWRVYFRVNGKQRSRNFARKGDADLFDADLKRKHALGADLVRELDRSVLTLDAFVRTGFRTHAATLAQPTRSKYAWALECHLADLVHEPLRAFDVPMLAAHQEKMLRRGATPSTVREVMTRLSGILQIAVEHGHLPANPVRSLRKVPADPSDDVNPLSPAELERVICALQGRDRAIALLAGHLGLRRIELRTAPWSVLGDGTLTVTRARTKRTAARTRTITVPRLTAHELRQWRVQAGRPGDREPIIGNMTENALRLWNRRVLRPLTENVCGRDDITLYTLRHSHASALHYAGYTTPEAAERLGHDEVTHVRTYAHVIRALTGTRYATLDELLNVARSSPGVAPGLRNAETGTSR
jgi:integrase